MRPKDVHLKIKQLENIHYNSYIFITFFGRNLLAFVKYTGRNLHISKIICISIVVWYKIKDYVQNEYFHKVIGIMIIIIIIIIHLYQGWETGSQWATSSPRTFFIWPLLYFQITSYNFNIYRIYIYLEITLYVECR